MRRPWAAPRRLFWHRYVAAPVMAACTLKSRLPTRRFEAHGVQPLMRAVEVALDEPSWRWP